MKNHFYISYAGNKRQEVEQIYNSIDFNGITTVIEPFAGTSAMSYYISLQRNGLKYILNDNNNYLKEMFNILRDDDQVTEFENKINNEVIPNIQTKEKYTQYLKTNNDVYAWYVAHKFYSIRAGMFPMNDLLRFKSIDLRKCPIYNFYRNNDIEFYTLDGIDIYEKYKHSKHNLILLDPPYLSACNDFYQDSSTNIYEYLFNNPIENEEAQILLILENTWIIKLLFNNIQNKTEYGKKYSNHKKKGTTHIIISNK
jgi:hypothetical protein